MTVQTPSPIVQVLPETAPFSEEQRSWLNGFFAGLLSLDNAGVTALSAAENAAVMAEAEDAPWHDPSLALAERMKLADGKPLPRKLYAAMAQQDCGQCGLCLRELLRGHRLRRRRAAQSLRARRQGDVAAAQGAGRGWRRVRPARRGSQTVPRRNWDPRDAAAKILRSPPFSRAASSTARAPRRRPGMSSSTCPRAGSTISSATRSASSRRTMSASSMRVIALLGARPDQGIGRQIPARQADAGLRARSRAGRAVPADLVRHRRGRACQGQAPRRRRRPRWRSRPAGRARRPAQILAGPAFRRSLRRGARSASAAALLDLVVPCRDARPDHADGRHGALQGRLASAMGGGLDLPGRARRTRRQGAGLCPAGAWLRPAGRSGHTGDHVRAGHRHRALPRLLHRQAGDGRARPQLVVLRPPAPGLRLLL